MPFVLALVGVLAWIFAGIALVVGFTSGTDIQLIAAAVWGTLGAVCIGCASLLTEVRALRDAIEEKLRSAAN